MSEPSEGYTGVIEAGENLVNFKNTLETEPVTPSNPEDKPATPSDPKGDNTTPSESQGDEVTSGTKGIVLTGDNSSMYLYIALAATALIIIGVVVFMKKKNNHSKAQ